MSETLSDRLRHVMTLRNVNNADISRAVGVTPATVKFWVDGRTNKLKYEDAIALADFLKVSSRWLVMGKGSIGIEEHSYTSPDYVMLSKLDLKASCGTGLPVLDEAQVDSLKVSATWFSQAFPSRIEPENVRIVTAAGDSMSPLIDDGDLVFLDIRQTTPARDGIYFLIMDDRFFIKRVQYTYGGRVILISENRQYRDIEVPPDSQISFRILGRVIKSFKAVDFK